MKIFKFKFPGFSKEEVEELPIKYKGQPIGRILDVEETEDGLIITGQFNEDIAAEPAFKHMFLDTDDLAAFSLGPMIPAETLAEYSEADVRMTMELYNQRFNDCMDEQPADHWIWKPGTKWGCLMVILAALGFWFVMYVLLHWFLTGNGALFDWS